MEQRSKVQVAEVRLQDLLAAIDATQPSSSSTEGSTLRRIRDHLKSCGMQVTLGSIAAARTEAESLGMINKLDYHHELTCSGVAKLQELGLRQKMAA